MRSDLVFDALRSKNRFVLCHEAFKAIRLFHKANTRVEDTANDALQRLAVAPSAPLPAPIAPHADPEFVTSAASQTSPEDADL